MLRQTFAEIDLNAIASNFHLLKSMNASEFFCPMVKANAYGHGSVEVAKRLEQEGAKFIGVSLIEEGIKLREAGVKINILVLGAFGDQESAKACLNHKLTPVISNWHQLSSVISQAAAPTAIHLKFDTGMSRLGFQISEASELKIKVESAPNLKIEGICTHLAKGDDAILDSGFSSGQFRQFQEVITQFQGLKFFAHALNSSGLAASHLTNSKSQLGSRPGIALYGMQPLLENSNFALKPAMTLKSTIVTSREVKAGQSVSYNNTWKAKRDSLIGILPIGYADGVPRRLSNQFNVLCRGQRIPAVGTVCMDYIMLDLTSVKDQLDSLGVGEEVVLFGQQGSQEISALEWAQNLGTITYEIFTSISNRVPRKYVST